MIFSPLGIPNNLLSFVKIQNFQRTIDVFTIEKNWEAKWYIGRWPSVLRFGDLQFKSWWGKKNFTFWGFYSSIIKKNLVCFWPMTLAQTGMGWRKKFEHSFLRNWAPKQFKIVFGLFRQSDRVTEWQIPSRLNMLVAEICFCQIPSFLWGTTKIL